MLNHERGTILSFRGLLGVTVDVDRSLIGLAMLFALFGIMAEMPLYFAALFLILLISIYLHELGHALGAILQRVPAERIVITGSGGFFIPARTANNRQQELIVATGPMVNLTLWAVSSLLVKEYREPPIDQELFFWLRYLDLFSLINLLLFFFNMIPVQPLDGGKLLHLALLRVLEPPLALKVVGGVGVIFSILWWPALIWIYLTFGWILLFAPSLWLHLAMWRG